MFSQELIMIACLNSRILVGLGNRPKTRLSGIESGL